MPARVIDGRAVAARLRERIRDEVQDLVRETGAAPGLATVLVGADPGSVVYVTNKQEAGEEVGIAAFDYRLGEDAPEEEVVELLERLNADERVSGVVLQLPGPGHLDGPALTERIDPAKDVDGLTPVSAGRLALGREGLRPATPRGVMHLLESENVALEGAEAVVVGRSNLFGKPMAQLLLGANATVTICHSRTHDLAEVCRRADVLVAAVGRDRMVKGSWIKPGATVIDVGINRSDDGLHGDVDFDES